MLNMMQIVRFPSAHCLFVLWIFPFSRTVKRISGSAVYQFFVILKNTHINPHIRPPASSPQMNDSKSRHHKRYAALNVSLSSIAFYLPAPFPSQASQLHQLDCCVYVCHFSVSFRSKFINFLYISKYLNQILTLKIII